MSTARWMADAAALAASRSDGVDGRLLAVLAVVGLVVGAALLAVGAGTRRPGDPDDRSAS